MLVDLTWLPQDMWGISLCLPTFFVRSLLCSAIRPKPYLLSLHTSVAMISTIYFFALLSINLEALQVMKLRLSLALLLLGAGGLSENPRRTELDFCPYERAASPPSPSFTPMLPVFYENHFISNRVLDSLECKKLLELHVFFIRNHFISSLVLDSLNLRNF